MKTEEIARVCHEANRAVTFIIKDVPMQPPWDEEDTLVKATTINGVEFLLKNPDAPPGASHNQWMERKLADGWTWGAVKNMEAREHPALVHFDELPEDVKRKDVLFCSIVKALR